MQAHDSEDHGHDHRSSFVVELDETIAQASW